MKLKSIIWRVCCLFFFFLLGHLLQAQKATVQETTQILKTYPFSDPDPVPKPGRIYPYFRFDGYTNTPKMQNWKFIELENQYLKVSITPEIGGKIWGAYLLPTTASRSSVLGKEKSSDEAAFPFVYFNHVVKFRDVAMRGAWTSGGIELNFGDIGHDPTVSNPVDYVTRTNADGSVSCFVGAWDWASHTRWTVEVNLPTDKAYFTTKSRWFNASPLDQTYYHWMNAGFRAAGDLEFVFPGINQIGHGGEVGLWPKDSNGRAINFYEKNDFGSYKSYHVLGQVTDFFGGYWHKDQVGFVHYAPYHEKLGKKVWVWGLSAQGMIWEKLLTDTDGQYVELQSGRLFNQAGENLDTPFKHLAFQPSASDTWTEHWYPVKNTGGIQYASEYGIINFKTEKENKLTFVFSTNQPIKDTLKFVSVTGQVWYQKSVDLKPLQIFADTLSITNLQDKLVVKLGTDKILFREQTRDNLRPLVAPQDFDWDAEYGLFLKGKDLANQRKFAEAQEWFEKCLNKNKHHVPALGEMAQLQYRKGLYREALDWANKALSVNTYDPLANYMRGLAGRKLNDWAKAKDGFSVAVLSTQFRTSSLTELAKIAVLENDFDRAKELVSQALEQQQTNDHAQHLRTIVLRKTSRQAEALKAVKAILNQNPLDHFARFEEDLLLNKSELKQFIKNELPHEDYIEMALWYGEIGLYEESLMLLKSAPNHPMCKLWAIDMEVKKARISNEKPTNRSAEIAAILRTNPNLVFPSRPEEIKMLERLEAIFQANEEKIPWQLAYYQGILFWQLNRLTEAKEKFVRCENQPDWPPFYLAKAELFKEQKEEVKESLENAYALAPANWRVVKRLAEYYDQDEQPQKGLAILEKHQALAAHEIYILGQQQAQLLVKLKQYKKAIDLMKTLNILPNEGASGAHKLFRVANIKQATELVQQKQYKNALVYLNEAETWPENLGSGQPYDPDNRLTAFMKTVVKNKDLKKVLVAVPKPEVNKADAELLQEFLKSL